MGPPKEAVGIAPATVPVAMEVTLFSDDAAGKETAGIATAAVPGAAALPGFANSLSIGSCFE